MTVPSATGNPRLDAAAAHLVQGAQTARAVYLDIPARTRRGVAAVAVFCVGLAVAVAAAQTMFDAYRQTAGPLVWDAAHGQQQAITTISAFTLAVVVFAVLARAVTRLVDRIAHHDTHTPPATAGIGGAGVGSVVCSDMAIAGGSSVSAKRTSTPTPQRTPITPRPATDPHTDS